MEHIPQLVIDLALLLTAAAIATVVCRRFKQPFILGYVIAGFLISPAIGWIPDIVDTESISTWSEIGVIFLMFGLGLEFSFVKLAKVGKAGTITALSEIVLMMGFGTLLGLLLGWSFFTSLFLGAMLAVSSTTIIAKTVEELGIKKRKSTELVFGALVIEDIASIFIMVIFSALAVGSAVDGGAIVTQLGSMVLYLVIWFVLSVLIVPTLIKKISGALNDEILLIASLAICFLMVVLANAIGFSAALGAFMAGSILAGTVHVHRIEKLFKPLKDLFGAVFFVSVGMLVSPATIVDNIVPILIVTVVTLVGKPLFSTIGALLARQSLKTSVQTGLSLAQIGEFSFIIAALGVSLGVTADFLYPIIVAVSVVTTLTTPFYIKSSDKVYKVLTRIVPQSLQDSIERRATSNTLPKENSLWSNYLKHWILKLALVVVAAIATVMLFSELVKPLLVSVLPLFAVDLIVVGSALLIVGVFISNLFYSSRKGDFGKLWVESRKNHFPLALTMFTNFAVTCAVILLTVFTLDSIDSIWLAVPALILTFLFARSKRVHTAFLRFENLFITNLTESTLAEQESLHSDENPTGWIEDMLYVTSIKATRLRDRRGRTVSVDFIVALACNLDLLSIKREGSFIGSDSLSYLTKEALQRRIVNPDDELTIQEGDELTFVGTEDEITAYINNLNNSDSVEGDDFSYQPLAEYLQGAGAALDYGVFRLQIDSDSEFKGKTIAHSGFKASYGCLVVALEHESLSTVKPSRNTALSADDFVWIIGARSQAKRLMPAEATDEDADHEPEKALALHMAT